MNYLLLIPVLVLAAFLRLFQLGSLPISLFGDEVDIGYQAWSLITTGKDYFGHSFPIYFKSLIEWRLPGLVYLTAPIIGLFGPSTITVRLLPAIFGILDIFLIYFMANKLYPSKILKLGKLPISIGIISAFLLTISPWHIHFSRAAFDVTLQLFLILSAVLLLISEKINIAKITVAISLLILSLYVYPTSVIFSPLIFALTIFLFRPSRKNTTKKQYLISGAVIAFVALPYLISIFSGTVSDRIRGINIFNDQKSVDSLITTRTQPWVTSQSTERIFHNKAFLYVGQFTNNYLTAFSADYLFINGDPNIRQSIGGFGELPTFLAPFLLIGLALAISNLKDKSNKFLLIWLLIAPLSSCFTVGGGNHATRLFLMLPPLIIFSASGIEYLINILPTLLFKRMATLLLLAISLIFVCLYWHQYSAHYRYTSSPVWDYGFKEIFEQYSKHQPTNRVFINNTYQPSLIKFAFYTKYPPQKFQKSFVNDTPIKDLLPGFSGFKFDDNIYFGQLNSGTEMSTLLKQGDVYLYAQRYEIPGAWDWYRSPPSEFNIWGYTHDIFNEPLFTIIERK